MASWAAAARFAASSAALLLLGDDQLGLVQLLVDDGELLGGLPDELAGLGCGAGRGAGRGRREHARGDGEERGSDGEDGTGTATGGRARGLHRGPPISCARTGEGQCSLRVDTHRREAVSTRSRRRAGWEGVRLSRSSHPPHRPQATAPVAPEPATGCAAAPSACRHCASAHPVGPSCASRNERTPGQTRRRAPGCVPEEVSGRAVDRPAVDQPARGSWAWSAATVSKSRRIAVSSSAVHASQQSQPPSA